MTEKLSFLKRCNMKKSILFAILCILVLFFLGTTKPKSNIGNIENVRLSDKEFSNLIKNNFPKKEFSIIQTKFGRFGVVFADSVEHFVITTANYSSEMGFQGYSNFAIIIDTQGEIERIIFLSSEDTEVFVQKIIADGILGILSKQNLFTQKRPTCLITGATMTTSAISKDISKTLDAFREIFDLINLKRNLKKSK